MPYTVLRYKDGWVIIIDDGREVHLSHHQYGRYLAWQRSDFTIQQMLPELSDVDHEVLMNARRY